MKSFSEVGSGVRLGNHLPHPDHLPFTSHSILPSVSVTIRPQQRIPTMIKLVRITGRIHVMGMLVVAVDGTVAVAVVDAAVMETQE